MPNSMPELKLPTQPPINPDIAAVARVSPNTIVYIVLLIVTISGWGWSTLANSRTNDKQDVQIEKKVNTEDANRQYDAIIKRLDELRDDIKELRHDQRSESPDISRQDRRNYYDRNK